MTDYDYYLPDEPLWCPRCRGPIAAWHGWDGPCRFVTWVQGDRYAKDPDGKAQVISPDQLAALRLPERFQAHTWCLHCWFGMVGTGAAVDGRWAEWILTDDAGRVEPAVPLGEGRRRCGNCLAEWEEKQSVPYRTCPSCDCLTKLVVPTV